MQALIAMYTREEEVDSIIIINRCKCKFHPIQIRESIGIINSSRFSNSSSNNIDVSLNNSHTPAVTLMLISMQYSDRRLHHSYTVSR